MYTLAVTISFHSFSELQFVIEGVKTTKEQIKFCIK